uniref:Uncharacterized protein n=1 Tax=Sinocyclocheilus rhinocerous TaxID=307959 RepID=A0A673JI86_9TELE
MGTRLKVLRVFKDLHKTRRHVFRDDDRALTVLRRVDNTLHCVLHLKNTLTCCVPFNIYFL